MSCYKPLVRLEDNKGRVTILPASFIDNQIKENLSMYRNKKIIWSTIKNQTIIPCGHCIGCKIDYSQEWAKRIMCEVKTSKEENCYFITLTYNDENIPFRQMLNEETGEIENKTTLRKKDIQNFLKRLRAHYLRNYGIDNIRYYLAGEYGENTERPHYHACIFNLPIPDLKYVTCNDGYALFDSEILTKIWGKGNITIGEITYESAAYTARYCMKKMYGKEAEEYYTNQGKDREFVCMSTKPYIGHDYFEKNKEKIYKTDSISIPKKYGAKIVKPPKIFDDKYKIENPIHMEKIKIRRKIASEEAQKGREYQSNISEEEQRLIKMRTTEEAIKKCIRDI